jgi:hypothetical protein
LFLLQGTHADKYEIYKKKEDERKSSRQSIYSLALQAPKPRQIKTKESYPIGHEQQIRFENNLVNFIVLDSMPFDTPERVGFNLLMQGLDDKLTIPSRRTVGRQIDTKYEKVIIMIYISNGLVGDFPFMKGIYIYNVIC